MNGLSAREAMQRANSGFRFYAYRKSIGRPVSLIGILIEWPKRFFFEWKRHHDARKPPE